MFSLSINSRGSQSVKTKKSMLLLVAHDLKNRSTHSGHFPNHTTIMHSLNLSLINQPPVRNLVNLINRDSMVTVTVSLVVYLIVSAKSWSSSFQKYTYAA